LTNLVKPLISGRKRKELGFDIYEYLETKRFVLLICFEPAFTDSNKKGEDKTAFSFENKINHTFRKVCYHAKAEVCIPDTPLFF